MASSLAIPVILSPEMNASTSHRADVFEHSLDLPKDEAGGRGGFLPGEKHLTIACLGPVRLDTDLDMPLRRKGFAPRNVYVSCKV